MVFAALTVVLVGAGATYLDFKTNSGRLAMSNLPVVVLIPFVFWLLTNLLLKVCTPRLSLSTGELRFVLSLLWTGGMFAGFNWITRWIGGMTAPRYYASPENRWEDLIFDYIPWWLYPTDAPGVVGRFYLGLGREALPWGAWIPPVFWTISAAVAMTAIGLGLTALFQRQWIQHERLTYPLAQASLDLTRGFDRRAGLPKLFRTRLFWVGFAVAALPLLFNLIEYWNPGFPHVSIFDPYYSRWSGHRGLQVSRFLFPISYRLLPTLTGFLFLCDVNILFSIWSLFAVGQTLLHGMYRIGLSAGLSGQSASPGELGNIFSHGAMMGLSVWTVWTARGHLKRVFRQVLRPESTSDVSVFAPRPAFIALIGGLIYLVFWLHAVGFGWLAALAWLVFFLGWDADGHEISRRQRLCLSLSLLGPLDRRRYPNLDRVGQYGRIHPGGTAPDQRRQSGWLAAHARPAPNLQIAHARHCPTRVRRHAHRPAIGRSLYDLVFLYPGRGHLSDLDFARPAG